jgi:hypothetical protein
MPTKEEILSKSIQYRGRVIHEVANLERWVDIYLATYFCGNSEKRNQILEMVFANNRMSFDSKRKLFENVLTKQKIRMSDLSPEFSKDLNSVFTDRNTFAHNSVYVDEEANLRSDGSIGFIKYSTNTRIDWYNDERVDEIIKTILRCIETVKKVHLTK